MVFGKLSWCANFFSFSIPACVKTFGSFLGSIIPTTFERWISDTFVPFLSDWISCEDLVLKSVVVMYSIGRNIHLNVHFVNGGAVGW